MNPFKIIFIFAIFIFGCKKDPDIYRPAFTSDQLQWIQNQANPKFIVVTQKKGITVDGIIFIDSMVTFIDTIDTQTKTEVAQKQSPYVNQNRSLYYYEGSYDLKFVNFYNFLGGYVNINNMYDFMVGVNNNSVGDASKQDTANINGVIYSSVDKVIVFQTYNGVNYTRKIYFKKGVGFLYLEMDSVGSAGSVNYSASLIQ